MFEKEEYASHQIGSKSRGLQIFKKEESDYDSDDKSLEAIKVGIHMKNKDDETSKWDIDPEQG